MPLRVALTLNNLLPQRVVISLEEQNFGHFDEEMHALNVRTDIKNLLVYSNWLIASIYLNTFFPC